MQNFSNRASVIAILLEKLWKGYNCRERFSKVSTKIPYFNCVRSATGDKGEPGWTADSLLTISALKKHSLLRKAVDIRGDSRLVTVATKGRPQVIDRNE